MARRPHGCTLTAGYLRSPAAISGLSSRQVATSNMQSTPVAPRSTYGCSNAPQAARLKFDKPTVSRYPSAFGCCVLPRAGDNGTKLRTSTTRHSVPTLFSVSGKPQLVPFDQNLFESCNDDHLLQSAKACVPDASFIVPDDVAHLGRGQTGEGLHSLGPVKHGWNRSGHRRRQSLGSGIHRSHCFGLSGRI